MTIRVLHVVTYMGRGGLETMIMNYYRHMDRSKVQFDFLVHRDFRADYDDEIESLGGRIYRIGLLVPWGGKYRAQLDRFFAEHPEYRIVHVHQDCLSAVALKVAKDHGVPVRIAHSHSSSQDKNLKYLIKLFYKRRIPRYATQLFACGKDAGDWMFGGAPYTVIKNAIDTRRYGYAPERAAAMREQLGIAKDALVVGHVGRFAEVKNHEFLLDVFAALHRIREDAHLLLVGDGELKADIEQKAEKMGVASAVTFAGLRSDVPDVMQAMDVFVFPSLYEGLPVSLVEAQAAGMPCLVSDAVPDACRLTELVEKLSLSDPADVWAERIAQAAEKTRENMVDVIARKGFDIIRNAAWLQAYYLEQGRV